MEGENPEIKTKLMAIFYCFFSETFESCVHQGDLSVSKMKMTHTEDITQQNALPLV